jgi:hypothetical protein
MPTFESHRPRAAFDQHHHHHRRYSWPPSLQLIDISNIHIPLPDIDDDPFAHFVSSPPAEDDFDPLLDALACSTGIFTPHPTSSASKEKAYKFRRSIARKWARFMGRQCVGSSGWEHAAAKANDFSKTNSSAAMESYYNSVPKSIMVPKGLSPHSSSRNRGKRRPVHHKWERHSWHAAAPSYDLYTIDEEVEPAF